MPNYKTGFSRHTNVSGEANSTNQLRRSFPTIPTNTVEKNRLCKLCGKKLPFFSKAGRWFKSEFCNNSHKQIYIRDLNRTKPKVNRGVKRPRT